jgi:hypothetical protein
MQSYLELRWNKANLLGPRVGSRGKPIACFLRQHTFGTPSGTRTTTSSWAIPKPSDVDRDNIINITMEDLDEN